MQLEHHIYVEQYTDVVPKELLSMKNLNSDMLIDHYQRLQNAKKLETEIQLMDISLDMQWICYVHQYVGSIQKVSTLSIRKLSAVNEETLEVETFGKTLDDKGASYDSRFQMESPEFSINLNKYFNGSDLDSKSLSISPEGRYIALSGYKENVGDTDGNCIIFEQNNQKIKVHRKITCNGRAIFYNRDEELCLAIVNLHTLKIYRNVCTSSKNMSYEIYEMTPFADLEFSYKDLSGVFVSSYDLSTKITHTSKYYPQITFSAKANVLFPLLAFAKDGILVTPATYVENDTIRLLSLTNDGDQLRSISAPRQVVIAISLDRRYMATTVWSKRPGESFTVNVYNIENSCLVYTLKSSMKISCCTSAIFCGNSRYLALSAIVEIYETEKLGATMVAFEIWNVAEQKSIYATHRSLGQRLKDVNLLKRSKLLPPFVCEIDTKCGKTSVKGFYYYSNEDRTVFTLKCFDLNIDDQQNIVVDWLVNEELPSNNNMCLRWSRFHSVEPKGQEVNRLTLSLDQLLNIHFADENDEILNETNYPGCKIITNHFGDGQSFSRCGFIESGNGKFFVCFGIYMFQMWKCNGDSDILDEDMKNYQLVYIKPYLNSDCPSRYLDPNIWRIASFENIKVSDGPPNPRVVLEIIEDDQFRWTRCCVRKAKSLTCTEEYILPTYGDDSFFDYKRLEGACQILFLLNVFFIEKTRVRFSAERATKDEHKIKNLFEVTMALITREIGKMDEKCNSFKTSDGSKTLAMLASFEMGRDILKLLLKNEAVFFNISGYSVPITYGADNINLSEEVRYRRMFVDLGTVIDSSSIVSVKFVLKESVLTILIREREYDLYHLMLNRILSDSKSTGSECLSILNDALLLLQELGNSDHYEKSCQKLTYLRIGNISKVSVEIPDIITAKADVQEDLIANVGNIFIFSTLEEIRKVKTYQRVIGHLKLKLKKLLHLVRTKYALKPVDWIIILGIWIVASVKYLLTLTMWIIHWVWWPISFFRDTRLKPITQFVICVVPLPYFNTYYHINVTDTFLSSPVPKKKINNITRLFHKIRKTFISFFTLSPLASNRKSSMESDSVIMKSPPYKNQSLFLQSALDQHSEPNIWKHGDSSMAILLQYKWRTFVRKRFLLICVIHAIYYASYFTGVQFAFELYKYDVSKSGRITDSLHIVSLTLFFLSGTTLTALELYQIPKDRTYTRYFRSWYNLVDIAAIVFPFISFLQLILDLKYFYEICSVTTLILWFHGIVRLRAFPSFGIALEIILQLFREVDSVLIVLFIVVAGFTHSFIALLRQKEDEYFQENYNGTTTLNSSITGITTLYDVSSSNGFKNAFKAFYQVYLFIFGQWDPVTTGDAGDNWMVFLLCMIFAFVTVLIFTNMIIALMSSVVGEVKQRGKKVWMTHFAAVIAEIENQTFTSTRRDRRNNPAFIYYAGNAEKVKKQEEKLRKETKELRILLKIDEDAHIKPAEDVKREADIKFEKNEIAINDIKLEMQTIKSEIQNTNVQLQRLYQLLESSLGNESQMK